MTTELAKSFEPAAIEAKWGPVWQQASAFAPTLDRERSSFSIQLPPPNVTGTLHMGHAFNHTIIDALTRYHRMRGHNTLWLPVPTMPASPRRSSSSGSSRTRA